MVWNRVNKIFKNCNYIILLVWFDIYFFLFDLLIFNVVF